jgi:hypothetical protein
MNRQIQNIKRLSIACVACSFFLAIFSEFVIGPNGSGPFPWGDALHLFLAKTQLFPLVFFLWWGCFVVLFFGGPMLLVFAIHLFFTWLLKRNHGTPMNAKKLLLCSGLISLGVFVANMIYVPIMDERERQQWNKSTYPWNFWTVNASGVPVKFMDTDGLDDPVFHRMYPSARPGLGVESTKEDHLRRVKRIPLKFKVIWRVDGDEENRIQELEFPQVSLGSDGIYVFKFRKDGKWTMEFDPDMNRPWRNPEEVEANPAEVK